MSAVPTFLRRSLCVLLSFCAVSTWSAAQDSPWLRNGWKQDITIPSGSYRGPGSDIWIGNELAVTWQEGSLVEDAIFRQGTSGRVEAKRCHFRRIYIGLSLWTRLDAVDCIFENSTMGKINPWYDTANSSTKWRFTNCIITKSLMGHLFTVEDCSVRAVNCTFIDLKTPSIGYRNNDVVNQAQQDWLKFEKCRFVNCEINESFLLSTVDCVFENCRYTGVEKKFAELVKRPFEVNAYWAGNIKSSYVHGNLKVNFISTAPNFKAGSTLAYSMKGKQLMMDGVAPEGQAVVLAGEKSAPRPAPAKPVEPAPVADSGPGEAVTGTAGAPAIPLTKSTASANALLVIDLPGQGEAGAAAKLSALALPVEPGVSSEVRFNQKVGPQMMTALREVVKCMQVRHQGWPRGQRIELAFEEKFVPKDGPSAAVACALLLDSMLANWAIDPALALTGDLNADGSVQPIGGVAGKIRGATKAGCKRVAVPLKNENAVRDVLVLEGPEPFARIEVFTIDTLDAAKALARLGPTTEIEQATQLFSNDPGVAANLPQASLLFQDARRILLPGGRWTPAAMRDAALPAKLREIVRLQPNHLSAKLLLAAVTGGIPAKLTLQGSIEAMDDAAPSLLQAISRKEVAEMTKIANDDLGDAVFKLKGSRGRMDPRVHPSLDALTHFGQQLRNWQNQPPRNRPLAEKMAATLTASAVEANRQRELLMNNRGVVEELMR